MFDLGDTHSLGLLLADLGFLVLVSLGLVVILKRFKIPAVLGLNIKTQISRKIQALGWFLQEKYKNRFCAFHVDVNVNFREF